MGQVCSCCDERSGKGGAAIGKSVYPDSGVYIPSEESGLKYGGISQVYNKSHITPDPMAVKPELRKYVVPDNEQRESNASDVYRASQESNS